MFSYPQNTEEKCNLPSPLLTDLSPFSFIPDTTRETDPIDSVVIYDESYLLPLDSTKTHSGSSALLANQAKCPFRAFAAHRLQLRKRQETSEGPDPRERGTMIHAIMEFFWQHVHNQQTLYGLDEDTLSALIDKAIEKAIAPYSLRRKYSFPPLVQTVERKRLRQLVETLLDWERQRPDFNVTAIETEYSIELSSIEFKVRIDRLDTVENESQWIIDYKTTLPQKTPWNEERPSEPQILLYALLDDHINTVLFIELKKGQVACKGLSEADYQLPGIKPIQDDKSWQTLRSQWYQQLTTLAQEFRDGLCVPKPLAATVCEQCDFPDLCRYQRTED